VTAASRSNETLTRLLPFVVAGVIILAGYFWFIQPKVTEYLRMRTDITAAETQVRTLQGQVSRGQTATSPDEAAALRLFEERVSADDRVAETVELLARLALDSGPKGSIKGLQIQTGPSGQFPASANQPARSPGDAGDGPDPRFGLFPVTLTYTPVTVSFDGSYDAIQRFAWRLRDLPTMIEIRSMELVRGLPLMKMAVSVFVYQRGAAAAPEAAPPAGAGASPQAPRVARLSLTEGW